MLADLSVRAEDRIDSARPGLAPLLGGNIRRVAIRADGKVMRLRNGRFSGYSIRRGVDKNDFTCAEDGDHQILTIRGKADIVRIAANVDFFDFVIVSVAVSMTLTVESPSLLT